VEDLHQNILCFAAKVTLVTWLLYAIAVMKSITRDYWKIDCKIE